MIIDVNTTMRDAIMRASMPAYRRQMAYHYTQAYRSLGFLPRFRAWKSTAKVFATVSCLYEVAYRFLPMISSK